MFTSDYCEVSYIEELNTVFVKWKRFCRGDDYRAPLLYALDIMKNHEGCQYTADTRDGFENEEADTMWLFDYFLPQAAATSCENIIFIINRDNSLKEELEGQSAELGKSFCVHYCFGMDEVRGILETYRANMQKKPHMLSQWPYIVQPPISGNIEADAGALLIANGNEKTLEHSAAVARTASGLAERFGLDPETARVSGLLHDISAVVRRGDMLTYAESSGWELDECERRYPIVLHQRVSEAIARESFGISDENVLSAVRCHSTLKAEASGYDMILFLADKISWDQGGVPPFLEAILSALDVSLESASLAYISYAMANGLILQPHKWLTEAAAWLESR